MCLDMMEAYGLQIVAGVPLVIQVVVFIVDVQGTLRLLIDCVPYSVFAYRAGNLVYVAATRKISLAIFLKASRSWPTYGWYFGPTSVV